MTLRYYEILRIYIQRNRVAGNNCLCLQSFNTVLSFFAYTHTSIKFSINCYCCWCYYLSRFWNQKLQQVSFSGSMKNLLRILCCCIALLLGIIFEGSDDADWEPLINERFFQLQNWLMIPKTSQGPKFNWKF